MKLKHHLAIDTKKELAFKITCVKNL